MGGGNFICFQLISLNMKKIAATIFLLNFCFITASFAQTSTDNKSFRLSGVFKDANSSVITGLGLFFEKDGEKINSVTDENGEFQVALSPGEYKLTASKTLPENFVSYIKIQENGINPNNIEFTVKPLNPIDMRYPKAKLLPRPPYPASARAVHAGGEVFVDIKINKQGNVFFAKATGGHSLLLKVSEQAARQSVFEASEDDLERNATLTYVFPIPAKKYMQTEHYRNPYRIEIYYDENSISAILF